MTRLLTLIVLAFIGDVFVWPLRSARLRERHARANWHAASETRH
jgi:hypothetical protein